MEILGRVADIDSGDKAGVGMEVRSNVLVLQVILEAATTSVEDAFVILSKSVTNGGWSDGAARTGGSIDGGDHVTGGVSGRDHAAKPGSPILSQPNARIQSAHAVEVAVIFAIDVDGADTGLVANIVTAPANGKIRARAAQRAVVGDDESRRAVVGNEEAQIPRTLLACKAPPKTRFDNAAGKEQLRSLINADIGIAEEI